MARYTVELGDVVKSGLKIFNFDYEFYDEEKKADFEQKFVNHFRFREIGQETVGRFQHYLKTKCDETLPYYNMLFRTALVDYEKTINYSLTETFTRTSTNTREATGTANQDGTVSRDSDVTVTGDKTITVDSTNTHTDDIDITKDETITKTSTVNIDNKKVGSDTPNGLLSMANIENNVYASRADIEDNSIATDDSQTNTTTDSTDSTIRDVVQGTNHDVSTDTTNENTTDTTNMNTATSQNETLTGDEDYTKILRGSYGVITEADMLQKHINLQKTLSKILIDFFNECEDLFMGVY